VGSSLSAESAGTRYGGVIGNGKETEREERGEKREDREKEEVTAVML
jgi:hypothetical protein